MVAPRAVIAHRFLDLLKIPRTVHNPDLAKGYCTPHFIYNRFGHIGGFNNLGNKLCSKSNHQKWDEHKRGGLYDNLLGPFGVLKEIREHLSKNSWGHQYFGHSRRKHSHAYDSIGYLLSSLCLQSWRELF